MKRLKKVFASTATAPNPDAKIIFIKAPFIQYEQLLADKIFSQYLERITVSKKILRMGEEKHQHKKHTK